MLSTALLDEHSADKWNEYVKNSTDATFFHLADWKHVLEDSLGHKAYFIYAYDDDGIKGVLPLIYIKSFVFGNSLSSLGFCENAGIACDNLAVEDVLFQRASELANDIGVSVVEFRNRRRMDRDLPCKDLYVNFRKEIHATTDENMKAIPRKQRAMVRKGIGKGLISEETTDWLRLYRVYAESVRNLGTPVFPKSLFRSIFDTFGNDCRVLMITHEGRDIAGVMSFYFKDQVLPYYAGSIKIARQLYANDFMYWELMRRSCEEGVQVFDYGRSKVDTGSYKFKKNWGFEPEPLYYEYYLASGGSIPDVNPLNPKYKAMSETWKKLPLPVANIIGPMIAKSLG